MPTVLMPVSSSQSVEIAAERPEGANRVVVPIAGHRNDMEGRADIDAGRIWVDCG
jgi:hypothetical protein